MVRKRQKISHAFAPISVHMELASLKLYMGDGVLLTMKSGMAQQLAARGYELFYWESEGSAELDFVLQKNREIIGGEFSTVP